MTFYPVLLPGGFKLHFLTTKIYLVAFGNLVQWTKTSGLKIVGLGHSSKFNCTNL